MRLWLLALSLAAAELLEGGARRAVTLAPGERRSFLVPGLEQVTGGSGQCIEEGLSRDEADTLWVHAVCGGVRTTVAWTQSGAKVQLLVCAEEGTPPAGLVALRKSVQAELKGLAGVTACIRNGRVELWGWVTSPEALGRVEKLEQRAGGRVRSFVEQI